MRLFENIFKNKGVKDILKDYDIRKIKEEIGVLEFKEKEKETVRQKLEKEVQKLFQESIGKSEATKRLNAIKISNLQQRIKDIDTDLREIFYKLRFLYQIQRLKEKAEEIYGSKFWDDVLDKVDEDTLIRIILSQKLKEEEKLERLRKLANIQEPMEKAEEILPEEEEIVNLMKEVEKGVKSPEDATKEVTKEKYDEEKETQ